MKALNKTKTILVIIMVLILSQCVLTYNYNARGNIYYYVPYAIICFCAWVIISRKIFNENLKNKIYKYGLFIILLIVQYQIVKIHQTFFILYSNAPILLIFYKFLPMIEGSKKKLLVAALIYFVLTVIVSTIITKTYDAYCISEEEKYSYYFNSNPLIVGCYLSSLLSLLGIISFHLIIIKELKFRLNKLPLILLLVTICTLNIYRITLISHNLIIFKEYSKIVNDNDSYDDRKNLESLIKGFYNKYWKYGMTDENFVNSNSKISYRKINIEIASLMINSCHLDGYTEKEYKKQKQNIIEYLQSVNREGQIFNKIQKSNLCLIVLQDIENILFVFAIYVFNNKQKNIWRNLNEETNENYVENNTNDYLWN